MERVRHLILELIRAQFKTSFPITMGWDFINGSQLQPRWRFAYIRDVSLCSGHGIENGKLSNEWIDTQRGTTQGQDKTKCVQ